MTAKVVDFNKDARKISLSIKAMLNDQEKEESSEENFLLKAIFSPLISLIKTFTSSPTLNTFFGFSTRPQDISEI